MRQLRYKPEVYPENILYIQDTPLTRKILKENFCECEYIETFRSFWYIKFDKTDNTWTPSFGHEWLYRDAPPLTSIDEMLINFAIDQK